eukprot:6175562-Pleurochrysis_carterae.AAC.2
MNLLHDDLCLDRCGRRSSRADLGIACKNVTGRHSCRHLQTSGFVAKAFRVRERKRKTVDSKT